MVVGGQRHAPAALPPVAMGQEARWAPGPVWKGEENCPHRDIIPQTVQPVQSRYTDWAISTHS